MLPAYAKALGFLLDVGGLGERFRLSSWWLVWLWFRVKASAHSFPRPLISYIRKFYYYDPQEEVYLSLKEAQLISKQKQETESST